MLDIEGMLKYLEMDSEEIEHCNGLYDQNDWNLFCKTIRKIIEKNNMLQEIVDNLCA